MNFHTLCDSNTAHIETRYADCLAVGGAARIRLEAFASRVSHTGAISVNMRPTVLLDFLHSGSHQNIHEWVDKILPHSSKTKAAILQEKLGDYYERRLAFDGFFDSGEQFHYGALTIGGLGPVRYGEYCVVVSSAAIGARGTVGYLLRDSLSGYVTSDAKVDVNSLEKDCALDSQKHCLATVKHAFGLSAASEDAWPTMLCSGDDYVEAIFTGGLRSADATTVRIARIDYELYWEYAFNEFRSKLSELDRFRVDTFAQIVEKLETLGVGLEAANA
jgi:hypothetical protein